MKKPLEMVFENVLIEDSDAMRPILACRIEPIEVDENEIDGIIEAAEKELEKTCVNIIDESNGLEEARDKLRNSLAYIMEVGLKGRFIIKDTIPIELAESQPTKEVLPIVAIAPDATRKYPFYAIAYLCDNKPCATISVYDMHYDLNSYFLKIIPKLMTLWYRFRAMLRKRVSLFSYADIRTVLCKELDSGRYFDMFLDYRITLDLTDMKGSERKEGA